MDEQKRRAEKETDNEMRERRFFTAAFISVIAAIIAWAYIGIKML